MNPRILAVALAASFGPLQADDRSAAAEVDAAFKRNIGVGSPGCAVAVLRDGRAVHSAAYGLANIENDVPLTTSSVFMIASTTKEFTGFLVQLLRSRGKISLDDSIRKYIPELPALFQPITLNHLLHHTSGIPQSSALAFLGSAPTLLPPPQDELLALSRLRNLNHLPGAEFSYSGDDYTLLGIIISRVAGMSLAEFARREIFAPLGMNDTRYVDDAAAVIKHRVTNYAKKSDGTFELSSEEWALSGRDRFPDGSISVMSTVEDFVKWDRNFTDASVGGGNVIQSMLEGGHLNSGEPVGYGSGLFLGNSRARNSYGHPGTGHGNRAIHAHYPDQHFSVIDFCNWDSSPATAAVADRIADFYLGEEGRKPPEGPKPIQMSAEQLRRFTGWYRSARDGGLVRVRAVQNTLGISFTVGAEGAYVPVSQNEFHRTNNMVEDGIRFQGDKMLSLSTGEVWNGVELATPESIKFSDYAGDWFSPDLDVFYRFTAKDGHLVWSSSLNRLGFEPISRDLTPSTRDQFWFGESPNGTNFEFIRDTRGTVTGLIVTHPRARNIRFERATGNR